MNSSPNPKRAVADLKELRRLTADENGAQRAAFTPTWTKARAWPRKRLEALPAEIHNDPAGNAWTTLRGESIRETCGQSHRMPSGPLHDATEVARHRCPR